MFLISSRPLFFCVVLFSCGLLSSCSWGDTNVNTPETPSSSNESGGLFNGSSSASQIDIARRRVALRSVIRKGDYYNARNEATRAVEYYEKAFSEIKEDPQIALRLANAYLELKQFRKASDIFEKFNISQFDESIKRKIISSILLDVNRTDRKEAINKLEITGGTKEYLSLLDDCIIKPNECLGSIDASTSADYQIQALRETISNARAASDDKEYIKALLMGKLYEQKAFLAVKQIGNTILEIRPNYKVILKIVGYSNYELGNYEDAAKVLEQYYTLEPKDVEVAYMLGVVNYFKEDYSTSNLYFNSAVLNGYSPKTELERRLVYNYALLGDIPGAAKIFRFLLEENDVLPEDYHVALFMSEQAGEYSKVSLWSRNGLQKFPEDAIINAFAGVASRRKEELDDAEVYLLRAKELDASSPLISLELARLYYQKNQYDVAEEYLTDTIGKDGGGFFAEQAESLLKLLPLKDSGSLTGTTSSGEVINVNTTPPLRTPATSTTPLIDSGSETTTP